MQELFGLSYLVLFLGFALTSFIILFHIARYSLNRPVALFSGLLFTLVMLVLLSTNMLLFFSLPWDSFFAEGFFLPS